MNLETFLARLYTDDALRSAFLAAPLDTALAEGASPSEAESLAAMNPESLTLAARGFTRKRDRRAALSETRPKLVPKRD